MKNNSFPELEELLSDVKASLIEKPANLAKIKSSLEALLLFLTTPSGRTDKNCRKVDLFFCMCEENGFGWDHLPEEFKLIIDDMSMQLHDTIGSPDIAEEFESTPEQLLKRVRNISLAD